MVGSFFKSMAQRAHSGHQTLHPSDYQDTALSECMIVRVVRAFVGYYLMCSGLICLCVSYH